MKFRFMSLEARWRRLVDPINGRRSRMIFAGLLGVVFVLLLAASVSRWSPHCHCCLLI